MSDRGACLWPQSPLGDLIADLRYGTSATCDAAPEFGVPVLRIPNVVGGKIDLLDLKYTIPTDGDRARYGVEANDILLVRTNGNPANIGRSALVRADCDALMYASYLIRIRCKQEFLLPDFLQAALQSRPTRASLLRSASTSAGNYNINAASLRRLVIPLPPLDEQRRIAEVLRSLDRCHQAAADEIIQLERVRTATAARAFSETAAGCLPERRGSEGWKRVRLRDLFTERKECGISGLPVASVSIEAGLVLRSSLDRRVESALGDDEHSLVRKNDIAYNMMRMWQGACGLAETDCLVSPAYVVMTPSKAVLPQFALLMLRAPAVVKLLHAYSQGIVEDRLRLYPDAFGQIPLNLPPLEWQREVVEEFAALDVSLERARRAQERLLVVSAEVLNDLLSGRIRVPE